MTLPLVEVASFLDSYLRVAEIPDDQGAHNGLQVEAGSEVVSLAVAVDASLATIEQAAARGADLLLVHHGLLWGGPRPLVGPLARKLGLCFRQGLSVYSAHLPLDIHPECGNNVGLIRLLGLSPERPFGRHLGLEIGLAASCDLSRDELAARLTSVLGTVRVAGAGPGSIRRLGVVTGSGGSLVGAAAATGLDALVTGEVAHHAALEAEERGIHLFLCGHYRSEVLGVRALARVLAERFALATFFVEHDSGL